jgi:uncharacterized repeat protein (TIGR03803 family)
VLNPMRSALVLTSLAIFLSAAVFAPLPATAQKLKVLYEFKGGEDGLEPSGGLVQDAAGNFYGTTISGGGSTNCHEGCGTVYKLDTHGKETVLYRFTGLSDGQYPWPVVLDKAGNIYGTTFQGGISNCENYGSCGVVYKLEPGGTFTVLHTFKGEPNSDGANPESGLVMDSSGNLYGTTVDGGTPGGCPNWYPPGCGTVYKIDTHGKETILHYFDGEDGQNPSAGLILDRQGDLYGSTLNGAYRFGTVFKLSPDGKETVLHNFSGGPPDNGYPYDGLARDDTGNLYGTTEWHPSGSNIYGTVFKLSPKGDALTTLFTFDLLDGGYPLSGLIRDSAGTLYGTTAYGGNCKYNGCGTVFRVDRNGDETVLYNFHTGPDGHAPSGILLRDQAGNLYGTSQGGTHHAGLIYEITH